MNMFASTSRDSVAGSRWLAEIRSGVEQVSNVKAVEALREARAQIAALLDVMSPVAAVSDRGVAATHSSPASTLKAQ